MRKTRIITTLVFTVLIALSWVSVLNGIGGMSLFQKKKAFTDAEETGDDYMERGLYQLAISEYKKAVDLFDSIEIRKKLLDAFAQRYSESDDIEAEYILAVKQAVDKYPENREFYILLLELYMEQGSYYQANKYVTKALERGIDDKQMQSLALQIRYGTTTGWDTFDKFRPYSNGTYAVQDGEFWRYVTASGASTGQKNLLKAFSFGDESIRIQVEEGEDGNKKKAYLIDGKGVLRGKLPQLPKKAGIYSEGLIALCYEEYYSYYNSLGDFCFGNYQKASAFQDGMAVVNDGNGFVLIDHEGNPVSDLSFVDVKMDSNGKWLQDLCMLAADEEGYHLYKVDGTSVEQIGDRTWEKVDMLRGDKVFAFEERGKWGFADISGDVFIKANFEEAKSFSRGLSAVRKGNKWGFINTDGVVAIDYQFLGADYFNESGSCMVKTEETGKWQLITLRLND